MVTPIVAFVAWILFVTEEIGHTIEDPFGKGLVTDPDDVSVQNGITEVDIYDMFQRMDREGTGEINLETLQVVASQNHDMHTSLRVTSFCREHAGHRTRTRNRRGFTVGTT